MIMMHEHTSIYSIM